MSIIGIDASRNRSGGAKVHLIGILNEIRPENYGFEKIHVWSYPELLDLLPERDWLIKHSPTALKKSIFNQLFWQFFIFPKELKKNKCDIVLNTDGGTVCRYKPSVTMSRDMLSYEKGEIDRYKYGKSWLRLLLLKYIQNSSFKHSTGVIFLTNYAANVIQKSCGRLRNIRIIPHGVSEIFANQKILSVWPSDPMKEELNCLYVSNTAPYKHQWKVIEAIYRLRKKGYKIVLTLAGAEGKAQNLVERAILEFSAEEFVIQLGHIKTMDLPCLISKSNIFIFASSCENMPNTLIEAMSVGLPIACSNRGPMPEVLGECGLYFDPEVVDTIERSIETIILDKSIRLKISNNVKEKATRYSWKRCADETMNYLKDILNGVNKNEK